MVVDSSSEPVAVADDPRIRVIHLAEAVPVGAARNLGVEAARGDLVAHWDDDDWSRADRLSRAVAAFTDAGLAATGLSTFVRYEVLHGQAWRYTPLADDRPFLAGGTLVHRREVWKANPFPEIDVGEDGSFVAGLDPRTVRALDDDGWFVAIGHGGNRRP